jgi:hypothetical protein
MRSIDDRNEIVAVRFPRAALPLRDDELARLTAVRVQGATGWAPRSPPSRFTWRGTSMTPAPPTAHASPRH